MPSTLDITLYLLVGASGFIAGRLWISTPSTPPAITTLGEVSDLLERLTPIADTKESWRDGVELTFTGKGTKLHLRLKGGSELRANAKTLPEAVRMLSEPNTAVTQALAGWPGESK
jgi:hypothetical protein